MREELNKALPSDGPDDARESMPSPEAPSRAGDNPGSMPQEVLGAEPAVIAGTPGGSAYEESPIADASEDEEFGGEERFAEETDWKENLRNSFDDWLETLEDMPGALDERTPATEPAPDLYSFYAALTAMASENRKANRKFAEALNQWQEGAARNQAGFEQMRSALAILASEREMQEKRLSRPHCLAMVEILDRMRRLSKAFVDGAPAKTWWSRDDDWRKAWATQGQAFDILVGHFEALLKKEGVTRIETIGRPLDPLLMMAVAAEPDADRPHQTVVEEVAAGYYHNGGLLRVAQVKVTTRNNNL